MAVYAIGDVQGCYDSLNRLLEIIKFDVSQDRLWFTGDLVNRGTQSLATLRLVRHLEPCSITVLGNHDLHMLAVAAGVRKYRQSDTFADVLRANDGAQLLEWLRWRPLFHLDAALGYCLVHAGVLPCWSIADSQRLANEVSAVLRGENWVRLLEEMYGNEPCAWSPALQPWARYRVVINVLTRMRFVNGAGVLDFHCKGPPGTQPAGWEPWYDLRHGPEHKIVFGHWSALGAQVVANGICLDSGCVWGGKLTAVRLDTDKLLFRDVDCEYTTLE